MKHEWKMAMQAAVAASGVGFSSGSAIAFFFAQTGRASWLGVAAASVLFGLFCGGARSLAKKTGAESLICACMRLFGVRIGGFAGAMHVLVAAAVGWLMLCRAGSLAALGLPVRSAYWMGLLLALMAAMLLNMRRMKYFPWMTAMVTAVCIAFHAGLALDPSPVRFYRSFQTVAELSGSVPAALILAGMYAALCASISAGRAMHCPEEGMNPAKFALCCAAAMAAMLLPANAAMLRGGEKLLSLPLPTVALAARWGTFGYYICIVAMLLPAAATLSACVGILMGQNEKHDKNPC